MAGATPQADTRMHHHHVVDSWRRHPHPTAGTDFTVSFWFKTLQGYRGGGFHVSAACHACTEADLDYAGRHSFTTFLSSVSCYSTLWGSILAGIRLD